jgi:hypothetical protein
MSYCRRCNGYSAEVGPMNDDCECEHCELRGVVENAIVSADWEPGDAQRSLQDLRDKYRSMYKEE